MPPDKASGSDGFTVIPAADLGYHPARYYESFRLRC
jgi:hypothetical protein